MFNNKRFNIHKQQLTMKQDTNIYTTIMLGWILLLLLALIVIILAFYIKSMKKVSNGGYPMAGKPKKYSKQVEDKLRIVD